MDHLVQFTISIDDKHIAEMVEKSASKALEKEVLDICREHVYHGNSWNRYAELGEPIKNEIRSFFDTNKNEIIDAASTKLAERMMRSKAIKQELIDSAVK